MAVFVNARILRKLRLAIVGNMWCSIWLLRPPVMFVASTDGFELAETDFKLRGPGDIFGTKQHGLPPLRIADLLRDGAILDEARGDAQTLVAADPGLSSEDHAKLRRMMIVRYGKALELGDVG